jgi:hypothetical protein
VYHCPPTRSVRIVFLLEELGIPYKVRIAALHACCLCFPFPVCKVCARRTSPSTGASSKMLTPVVSHPIRKHGPGIGTPPFSWFHCSSISKASSRRCAPAALVKGFLNELNKWTSSLHNEAAVRLQTKQTFKAKPPVTHRYLLLSTVLHVGTSFPSFPRASIRDSTCRMEGEYSFLLVSQLQSRLQMTARGCMPNLLNQIGGPSSGCVAVLLRPPSSNGRNLLSPPLVSACK